MVAPGQQCRARRRTKRRRVKPVVAEPFVGEPLQRRHVHRATERARVAEADVVEQDHQHVRCSGRRAEHRRNFRLGIGVGRADLSVKVARRNRQRPSVLFVDHGSATMQWPCARRLPSQDVSMNRHALSIGLPSASPIRRRSPLADSGTQDVSIKESTRLVDRLAGADAGCTLQKIAPRGLGDLQCAASHARAAARDREAARSPAAT